MKELPDIKGHSQKQYLETITLQVSLMGWRKGFLLQESSAASFNTNYHDANLAYANKMLYGLSHVHVLKATLASLVF